MDGPATFLLVSQGSLGWVIEVWGAWLFLLQDARLVSHAAFSGLHSGAEGGSFQSMGGPGSRTYVTSLLLQSTGQSKFRGDGSLEPSLEETEIDFISSWEQLQRIYSHIWWTTRLQQIQSHLNFLTWWAKEGWVRETVLLSWCSSEEGNWGTAFLPGQEWTCCFQDCPVPTVAEKDPVIESTDQFTQKAVADLPGSQIWCTLEFSREFLKIRRSVWVPSPEITISLV